LLSEIAVHVTGNSSVVLEALQAGKPSIVIDHYGQEYYKELIAAGNVTPALEPGQLRLALQRAISREPAATSCPKSTTFLDFLAFDRKPRVRCHP
jgi:glycosyltransferase involved in cell wall biosynthesis